MSLPTMEQLSSLTTIRFPQGNSIPYGKDFCFYQGIPADVDWYIAKVDKGTVSLVRPGHGVSGNYGDGSLLVSVEHLRGTKA